jgi:hypothetical protein
MASPQRMIFAEFRHDCHDLTQACKLHGSMTATPQERRLNELSLKVRPETGRVLFEQSFKL